MRQADVVVVGSGVIGAATAWRISRAGRRVILLERYRVGHTRGSSHGTSRIFRFSYDDPLYVGMAMEALPLWRELERESGQAILTVLGGLDFGKELQPHASALGACGAAFELIDGAEATRRFPSIALAAAEPVLFQPDAGVLAADVAVRALVRSATHHGVELHEEEPVVQLRADGDRAEARTEREIYRAGTVVVTAGAWAQGLLDAVGIDLPVKVSRQTVAHFRFDRPPPPPILVDWADSTVFYGLLSPGVGIKVGEHRPGPPADPHTNGAPDRAWVGRLGKWLARLVPAAARTASFAETCLYTSTTDERFILERRGPIVVGSACSGHAFKFAPVIGQRLGELAAE